MYEWLLRTTFQILLCKNRETLLESKDMMALSSRFPGHQNIPRSGNWATKWRKTMEGSLPMSKRMIYKKLGMFSREDISTLGEKKKVWLLASENFSKFYHSDSLYQRPRCANN